ncbi:MAG: hypothetical protein P8L68_17895 [Paracoccaceae bacterium]|nr:hypothetical protein [Paracoccaceae bacterium]MDG2260355.1 hypothetical protein [Paracoccaceae bacterium]
MSEAPYEHGFETVQENCDSRRDPLIGADELLPAFDCDLTSLVTQFVIEQPRGGQGYRFKRRQIAAEFIGKSQLCLLNGCLIATLRKREWPERAPALFTRLWAEHSDHLLNALDMRWKVSSITTFSNHGQTESQRRLGQSLSTLFGLMKLYEPERLFTGLPPSQPHRRGNRKDAPLPLEMETFSIRNGGLDVNLLGPIWEDAQRDTVAGPLATDLLQSLIDSGDTVFARMAAMRRRMKPKEKL